jgi:hypothetical protein
MLHDPAQIESALAPLVGLPLWASARAADLQTFQFGAKHTVTSKFGPRKGQTREVGEYSLHVASAWRIHGPRGIVVGSADLYLRAGPDPLSDDEDWDWMAQGANRRDERILELLASRTYEVERVLADATGGIAISLADKFVLDVFPNHSRDGQYSEHWRLFRTADLTSHFVVSGRGLDLP